MATCNKCNDSFKVTYYHDAGDHFGAGTAPDSEWKERKCDCTEIIETETLSRIPKCCIGCVYLDSDSLSEYHPPSYFCLLNIMFPVRKQTCKKRK